MDWIERVEKAQRGDVDSFDYLVQTFGTVAFAYAYSILLNRELAQDCAQEALIQSYLSLRQLREPKAFPGWLRGIVFSQCTRHMRGRRPNIVPLDAAIDIPGPYASFDEILEQHRTRELVHATLRSLPDAERQAVVLFYFSECSHKETGEFLGVQVSTIKNRLHSARAKLRRGLEEIMEQTLSDERPDSNLQQRVIEGVRKLKWGETGECTFAGALGSATAVTEYPTDYQTLLGVTGLAFRVRWFQGDSGAQRWCPSSPVGEFPEEIESARKATGWALETVCDYSAKLASIADRIVRSIDQGLPVLCADSQYNIASIMGYQEGGRKILMQAYTGPETPIETDSLALFAIFLGERTAPLPPSDAARQGIDLGVSHWNRGSAALGVENGDYWYGLEAYKRWAEDLLREDLSENENGLLFFVSWWTFDVLADMRRHAGSFLRQVAPLFDERSRSTLEQAAQIYDKVADLLGRSFFLKDRFFGPWSGKTINDWTPEVRKRESDTLLAAKELEAQAVLLLGNL